MRGQEIFYPEAVVFLRKFNLLSIGISLSEQNKMTSKEIEVWRFIMRCNDRKKKNKREIEKFL